MRRVMRSNSSRYGAAAAASVLAMVLIKLVGPRHEEALAFLFVVSVMLSSWHGGIGPGLLNWICISAGLWAMGLQASGGLDLPRLGLGVLSAVLVGWLSGQRNKAEQSCRIHQRRQAAVAELGRSALRGVDLQSLLNDAAALVIRALGVRCCWILEAIGEERQLRWQAGAGWPEDGQSLTGDRSQAGRALVRGAAWVVNDVRSERSCSDAPVLLKRGLLSGASVVMQGQGRPLGVLSAHAGGADAFSEDDVHFLQSVANVLGAAIDRRRADEALRESEARTRTILDTAADGIITLDEQGTIESCNPAALRMFGCAAEQAVGQEFTMFLPQLSVDDLKGAEWLKREGPPGTGTHQYLARRRDGSSFPVDLAISELRLRERRIVTAIVRDRTERQRLEREILQVSEREQRRIGQDLHDGLGQTLTAASFLTGALRQRLKGKCPDEVPPVGQVAEMVQQAMVQARTLAKGLHPVQLEARGLMTALRNLAEQAQDLFKVECRFECAAPVLLVDAAVAVNLYRIAQEAVSNAVKHAKARRISLSLFRTSGAIGVTVSDDGVGFDRASGRDEEVAKHGSVRLEPQGMGLRIMRYRAETIGATLQIRSSPSRGTVVACLLADGGPEKEGSTYAAKLGAPDEEDCNASAARR